VVEIFGPESSGKTTLTLHAIAEAQRAGGICAFVDAEHALDVTYARALGVDIDALLIAQPDNGEQALEITETLVRSGAVDLVVVDSVAALVPRAELEGDMGDTHVGLQARLMSQALRKITAITGRTGTCVVFINQLRQKIGVMFGNGEVTTGGNALKFYASIRVDIRRIGAVKAGAKDENQHIGNKTRVRIVKNKLAPPFRTAEVEIMYGRGICRVGELLVRVEEEGLLQRSGAWYSIGEDRWQGRETMREELLGNPATYERVAAMLQGPAGPATAK
jgi:recombination protein RecA